MHTTNRMSDKRCVGDAVRNVYEQIAHGVVLDRSYNVIVGDERQCGECKLEIDDENKAFQVSADLPQSRPE